VKSLSLSHGIAVALGCNAAVVWAQDAASPVGPGSVLQVLSGLGVVLLLVVGTAWLLRRLGRVPGLSNHAIKTIGATAVGTRERVVLLEVADTWILVGVAPGQVRQIAMLPRGEVPTAAAHVHEPMPFANWLKRSTDGRHAT